MSFQHKINWPDMGRILPNRSIWYPPMTFGSDFQQSLKGRNFAWRCFSGVGREAEKTKRGTLRPREASSPFLHIYVDTMQKGKTKRWAWKKFCVLCAYFPLFWWDSMEEAQPLLFKFSVCTPGIAVPCYWCCCSGSAAVLTLRPQGP